MPENIESQRAQFKAKIDKKLRIFESGLQAPPINPGYSEIAAQLLILQENGVSVFNGGPLEYRKFGIDDAWLLPVEVNDKRGYTNFHVIYLNCNPQNGTNIQPEINYSPTTKLKLGDYSNPEVLKLNEIITNGDQTPRIIIRPSLVGSLYFPQISSTLRIPKSKDLVNRLGKLTRALNIPSPEIDYIAINKLAKRFVLWEEFPQFAVGQPDLIHSEAGDVFMYPVISPDDPWQSYQIFTPAKLEKMNKYTPIVLRTDSGCDIGQLYRDRACDCRDQLLTAIREIREKGGLVIHLPTQDGRGYGLNTKMETEGIKRGIKMIFNHGDAAPRDTIEAAKIVFDNNYDIRTYDGVGRILKQLGFRHILLLTDNRIKVLELQKAGLIVDRVPTGTTGNDISELHIQAKHRTEQYFDSDCSDSH